MYLEAGNKTLNLEDCSKLIAQFMGREGKYNKGLYWVNVEGVKWVSPKEMKFHTSWDWLMSVVEKIEQQQHGVIIHSLFFREGKVSIHAEYQRRFKTIEIGYGELKQYQRKEATFRAVVQYIIWYNVQVNGKIGI